MSCSCNMLLLSWWGRGGRLGRGSLLLWLPSQRQGCGTAAVWMLIAVAEWQGARAQTSSLTFILKATIATCSNFIVRRKVVHYCLSFTERGSAIQLPGEKRNKKEKYKAEYLWKMYIISGQSLNLFQCLLCVPGDIHFMKLLGENCL